MAAVAQVRERTHQRSFVSLRVSSWPSWRPRCHRRCTRIASSRPKPRPTGRRRRFATVGLDPGVHEPRQEPNEDPFVFASVSRPGLRGVRIANDDALRRDDRSEGTRGGGGNSRGRHEGQDRHEDEDEVIFGFRGRARIAATAAETAVVLGTTEALPRGSGQEQRAGATGNMGDVRCLWSGRARVLQRSHRRSLRLRLGVSSSTSWRPRCYRRCTRIASSRPKRRPTGRRRRFATVGLDPGVHEPRQRTQQRSLRLRLRVSSGTSWRPRWQRRCMRRDDRSEANPGRRRQFARTPRRSGQTRRRRRSDLRVSRSSAHCGDRRRDSRSARHDRSAAAWVRPGAARGATGNMGDVRCLWSGRARVSTTKPPKIPSSSPRCLVLDSVAPALLSTMHAHRVVTTEAEANREAEAIRYRRSRSGRARASTRTQRRSLRLRLRVSSGTSWRPHCQRRCMASGRPKRGQPGEAAAIRADATKVRTRHEDEDEVIFGFRGRARIAATAGETAVVLGTTEALPRGSGQEQRAGATGNMGDVRCLWSGRARVSTTKPPKIPSSSPRCLVLDFVAPALLSTMHAHRVVTTAAEANREAEAIRYRRSRSGRARASTTNP